MPEKEVTVENSNASISAEANIVDLRYLIYTVRGQQVMLDNNLAFLYQVETGALNRAVKRNIDRFPRDFCFQLTKEEYENLKCQIGISSGNSYGGRRTLPFVFTEQGISMLAGILHSNVAVDVSIRIMRSFVEMRRFIATNSRLFERVSNVELKQLEYQKSTDERFNKVFQYIEDHAESEQKIFFDGQIYDAFSLLVSLIQKARREIVLIDGYVDINTLNILAKKNVGVNVKCYTYASSQLTEKDIAQFNMQYATLTVKKTQVFHDRFLIIDGASVYHIGASLKDAGKKCFGISLLNEPNIIHDLIERLRII